MPIDSSKFFDSIRIKPNKLSANAGRRRAKSAMCEWRGKNKGPHRALGRENSAVLALLSHRPQYNQSYNFFQGHGLRRARATRRMR